eukprot:5279348-Pyramimonas_sp.AAC.1
MSVDISLAGLQEYIEKHGMGRLIKSALEAHGRQLRNWWPDTLRKRYGDLPHPGTNDDGKRQCL